MPGGFDFQELSHPVAPSYTTSRAIPLTQSAQHWGWKTKLELFLLLPLNSSGKNHNKFLQELSFQREKRQQLPHHWLCSDWVMIYSKHRLSALRQNKQIFSNKITFSLLWTKRQILQHSQVSCTNQGSNSCAKLFHPINSRPLGTNYFQYLRFK